MRKVLIVRLAIVVLAIVAVLLVWRIRSQRKALPPPPPDPNAMRLSSPAFQDGQPIPVEHTSDGSDVSPPLEWTNVAQGTVSFALVMDDPDAPGVGTFAHWLICDIPARQTDLPEGVEKTEVPQTPMGAVQGNNGFRRAGYGGPRPPQGDDPHGYVFTLYALDCKLEIPGAFNRMQLRAAMEGHIVAQAQLRGTYQRQ
jgi:Raf kinase inhibitor-like YbhB/YbcL family protein